MMQKNSGMVGSGTLKTLETPDEEVLKVLRVGGTPFSPKFLGSA